MLSLIKINTKFDTNSDTLVYKIMSIAVTLTALLMYVVIIMYVVRIGNKLIDTAVRLMKIVDNIDPKVSLEIKSDFTPISDSIGRKIDSIKITP